jgi:thioredoxin 1
MSIVKITKDNFDEKVLNSQEKVLLDFWATWCGPCKMIAPVLEEIAEENESLTIGKINVDEEPELAISYNVASIPTLLIMEKGQPVRKLIGYRPKADVLKWLEE